MNTDIGSRLRIVRKEFGFQQGDFAEKLGVLQNALSQYENGNRKVPDEIMHKLVDVFEVNINWLLTGKGEMFIGDVSTATPDDDMLYIDMLDAEACAGDGIENFEAEVIGKLPIGREFIFPHSAERVKAVRVRGDSMTPTLSSGDVVLFVQGLNDGNGIYILLRRSELFVKRIHFKMSGGAIDIISDNPKYSNEELKTVEDSPGIIGKVIYQIHKLH